MQTKIIDGDARYGFLWKHFKDPQIDLTIFRAANVLLHGYQGGFWEYIETERAAPYLRLAKGTDFVLINPKTKQEIAVDRDLAGMVITYCVLLGKLQKGTLARMEGYNRLKVAIGDYCLETNRPDVLQALLN